MQLLLLFLYRTFACDRVVLNCSQEVNDLSTSSTSEQMNSVIQLTGPIYYSKPNTSLTETFLSFQIRGAASHLTPVPVDSTKSGGTTTLRPTLVLSSGTEAVRATQTSLRLKPTARTPASTRNRLCGRKTKWTDDVGFTVWPVPRLAAAAVVTLYTAAGDGDVVETIWTFSLSLRLHSHCRCSCFLWTAAHVLVTTYVCSVMFT